MFKIMLVIFLFACASRAQAQISQRIYEAFYLPFITWYADSETLQIEDYDSSIGKSDWLLYSLKTKSITPFAPLLPAEIEKTLHSHPVAPLNDYAHVYLSPDHRFAVYNVALEEHNYYNMLLVNVATGEMISFDNVRPQDPMTTFGFEVTWSANSEAFYVKTNYSSITYYDYFTGFIGHLEDVQAVYLIGEGSEVADSLNGGVEGVYDIDRTGRFLLLDTFQFRPNVRPVDTLLVMDMTDLSYQVITHEYTFANFEQTNDNTINYLSKGSIYAYNRVTSMSRIRLADIGINGIREAVFSPDGRYLALNVIEDDSRRAVYLLEIEPLRVS
jgi:hypothetical protein